ncbi:MULTISPECIES: periplasmic heavy metal sensor [unclassified Caballeronia]|uniref:periplasmic heavy metal sensor n=1 Tax=unclassified Caballeronia TaxID=2646786 RepID=UPI0028613930|nr:MULTISPECIES: periplasmic heavy metal sensor [unclassified Caballeronia]MDR5749956.1 periplasmic heavy metal sensor [Caballeronia sp. LZ024]MDR5842916.1 periplasmic heavy metal sensor [Caballeronia sp. LZ031]
MLKQSRILAVAAAALAMTIGAANAATPASDAPPPGGPGMAMGGPGGPGGHRMEMRMQKQLNELHGQLKLNADQEKLWQNALDTMKQNHTAMRESHKQMRDQFKSMAQQPILDLNAMHAAHQKIEEQNAQLREQTSTAWLHFYNALNDQQKTTVSSALKKHFAKMHEHQDKMHERWGKHRGAPGERPASGAAATTKP